MNNGVNLQGFCLIFLVLSVVGVQLAINKWIRKVTNTYWFWLAIGTFYLVYCICISWRFYWEWLSMIDIPYGQELTFNQSNVVSHALMLNICPFINFAFSVTLIADPTRKAARAISPLAIISSFMVLFVATVTNDNTEFTLRYIFIGSNNHPDLYFFGHFMNFIIAFGILLNTPKIGWKGTVGTYGYLIGFYTYVTIVAYSTGCCYDVSGVHLNDFLEHGVFRFFYQFFPTLPQLSMTFFFIGLIGSLIGINILSDVCKRSYFAYGDKYSGCWWRYYDYEITTIKEPWGWFSHNWQLKHPKNQRINSK